PRLVVFRLILHKMQRHFIINNRTRNRKDGEILHSYLSDLRLSYKCRLENLACQQEGAKNKVLPERFLLHREQENWRVILENNLDEILKNQRAFQAAAVKKGVDTGAEVSLICATVPSLEVRESCIALVSITNQRITIQGETDDVNLSLGSLKSRWKFLVVDNLKESVLGADFIESHYTTSWGIADNKLWLDDAGIPLMGIKNVGMVKDYNHSPVVANCTVELPARRQAIIPMHTKDKSFGSSLFEPTKTPGGVLLSKTAVEGGKDGPF
ncbi:Hypothetical predicted protein, partial [Paramuricea clavata]